MSVMPTMITTDEDLIDIPESKRKCRFNSEQDHQEKEHVFSSYSQNGCMFECQLKKAFTGPNSTNCLPWDSPHLEDPISVCPKETSDYDESYPYEKEPTSDCDCPVDCNVYGYRYSWDRQPMTGVSAK